MRDALEKFLEEFHDEKWALTMDEIRLELGLEGAVVFDNTAVPYPRDLIIVGHNFVGDMKILDLFNVDLYQFFDHIGVADTQVLVEDTADESLPQSLAGLVLMYKLYEAQKSGKAKGGFVFRDQHNAGNDAVANLKAFLRMATDSLFGTSSYTYDDEGDDEYMADVVSKTIDIKLDKPLAFRNPNLVMMCFDAEGVKQNASEFGFAWILASEIRDVPPGDDCQNWWPYVRAKHFLREKHTQHSRRYTDGNPWGFWKEFGQTERYSPNQGTTPFDRMLNEIIKQSSTSSTTQVVASDDAAPVVPPSPRKPTALAPHLRSPASTSQVVLSDDTAPVLAPHLRALAPHLRSPASTSQVVVSDDTAPVLPPHLRALHKPISATQVITSDETTPVLPPHLRVLPPHLRALHKPVSATQVVVSDDTAPGLPPHLRVLPPHLRALHKPASATRVAASDDAVPSLSPHLRNLDINQVEAARDQERQAMERRSVSNLSHDLG